MIARVGYFGDLTPEQQRAQEENGKRRFFPAISSQPGLVALLWMHTEDGGRVSLSVWETEEAMVEGARRANAVPLLPGMRGEDIPSPERIEMWDVKECFLAPAHASATA